MKPIISGREQAYRKPLLWKCLVGFDQPPLDGEEYLVVDLYAARGCVGLNTCHKVLNNAGFMAM